MAIHLPLDQMTTAEKLEAMELLWADLSKSPADVPVSDWHLEVLRHREQQVADGKAEFVDFEEALRDLQNERAK